MDNLNVMQSGRACDQRLQQWRGHAAASTDINALARLDKREGFVRRNHRWHRGRETYHEMFALYSDASASAERLETVKLVSASESSIAWQYELRENEPLLWVVVCQHC
jgi:hypothetical protein